jgi:3-oxoacyl-[acyl-carrier protein] reductase
VELHDKVAIVTGAGQGIGRAYARRLAHEGARVVVAEVNVIRGQAVAAEIGRDGGQAICVPTDVTSESSCTALATATYDAFGRVDALINNAAVLSTIERKPFWELDLDEWNQVLGVNAAAVFLATKAVVCHMQQQRWGRIINISSNVVFGGVPNYLHYVASKGAVYAMTRAMARELGEWNITVNTVTPGVTVTEVERKTLDPATLPAIVARQCIGRVETPDDLAGVVAFLCSDAAGFITGQTINVDGGMYHN